ncbi:MAG: hypothetical protein WBA91_07950 [Paracoccaceae bacterium]
MTLEEAIAQQPAWISYWLNWLLIGAFILPLTLFIWRPTRIAAAATIAAGVAGGIGTGWLYDNMGYVKLLGLPHIIVWTPLVIYLIALLRRADLPKPARWVLLVVVASILGSLAFDYTDVIRYALGERTPLAMPPASSG